MQDFLLKKIILAQVGSISIMEELQKTNSRLEQEIEVLRRSAQFSMGATSLTSVIEAQERKIKALELAQNVSILYIPPKTYFKISVQSVWYFYGILGLQKQTL